MVRKTGNGEKWKMEFTGSKHDDIKFKHIGKRLKILLATEWKTLLISIVACLIYSVGVIGFTIPYKFADQGVMGIAVLLKYTLGFNPAYVTFLVNVCLLIWGWRILSKRFVIWTAINVAIMTIMLDLLQFITFPHIDDMFLVAVTGGVIKGIGVGLLFNEGISGGGLDIIITALKKKYGIEAGKLSIYFNMCILAISFGIIGLDKVMYGFISCYINGLTMDNLLSSFDKRRLVFIVVSDTEAVVEFINKTLGRGCTLLACEGGYKHRDSFTIMSLLSQRQAVALKKFLASNFPGSFMVVTEANEVVGRGFKPWKDVKNM